MTIQIGMILSNLPQEGKKPGGVSVVVHELANALVRAGNIVRIYTYAPKPNDALYKIVQLKPFINLRFSSKLGLPFQLANLNFDDQDILHLHGEDWAVINRSIPTVRTFHGCSLNESKFTKSLKSKVIYTLYHPLELWAKKLANFSVGIGDDTVKLLGVDTIIPNGYAKELYYLASKAAQPTAIVVGTLAGRKQTKIAKEF